MTSGTMVRSSRRSNRLNAGWGTGMGGGFCRAPHGSSLNCQVGGKQGGLFLFFFFWFVLNPDNTAAIIYLSKATTLAFEINQSDLRSLSLPRLPPPPPLRGLQIYLRASRAPSPSLIFFFSFFARLQ